MAIPGLPFDHTTQGFTGLADTVAMAVEGIRSSDNLLAVFSWTAAGVLNGHDISDFTVANGTITAATISLASRNGIAVFTRQADS